MSDLIKREDAIKALCDAVDNKGDYEGEWLYTDEFCKAIDSVPSADRPQEWIPCNERVPKWKEHTDDMVLVCYADGSVRFNTFMNWQWVQGEPIAWMPLPKPWKGADDED